MNLQLRFLPIPLRWAPGDEQTSSRLRAILEPWLGTPYVAGQRLRGVGADCVGFACSVMDEMLGRSDTPRERLPRDAALNHPVKARAFMRVMLERYAPVEEVAPGKVALPGDIFVTGALGGGPGHVIIVGPDPSTT
ncbi:MAG: hypothetical protein AAB131_15630, partial [Actinomycetota bacterium]